jgi:hypothetical protein
MMTGEDDVKNRIRHVLHYKKASVWILGVSVIVLAVLGIGLFSDPGREPLSTEAGQESVSEELIIRTQEDLGKRFDLETMEFSGSREKDYLYYYDGKKYKPVVSEEISEEVVSEYENGAEVLAELREDYPDGTFQRLWLGNHDLSPCRNEFEDSGQMCPM